MDDVEPYKFGQSEPQAPVVLSGMDRIGERMTRRIRVILEPMVGAKPQVTCEAVSVFSYSNWCLFVPDFVSLSVYRLHPLKGATLLRIDADMVSALVDCVYGGTGARMPFKRKEFTPTEDRILAKFTNSLIEKLVESWAETHAVDATLVNRETNINYINVAGPDEQVVVQRFEVSLGRNDVWPIEFIYPLTALRGVEQLMGAKVHDELKISDPAWRERLGRQINHVRFPARSVLARPSMSLSQLMQLEPGDVIPVQINRSLPLIVGDRIFAHGTIGEKEGRAAFMIEKLAEGTEG
ncbi:MAG: FliM/FliN family flagellar motor switch protein [Alphaproteobacteria bacterium]|nr:FliM/FliN family flagellar motor switch protein [Alphaproteobacteria bacterium]